MSEITKKDLSEMYKIGYKTGFMNAVNFIKDENNELSKELIDYYNKMPLIDPVRG